MIVKLIAAIHDTVVSAQANINAHNVHAGVWKLPLAA